MMFVVFVSLGEAIWSPRWYDYSMSVAPEVCASRALLREQVISLCSLVCAMIVAAPPTAATVQMV